MGRSNRITGIAICVSMVLAVAANGEQSVARRWNEALLDAIRVDMPRPTIHARNFFHVSLTAVWSSQLDPSDNVLWDISPAFLGNLPPLPQTAEELVEFYDFFHGGDPGRGRRLNPRTGEPYAMQIVPRGDYTRVLAEFWADGPNSETPPGHWFDILNYVGDHPAFVKRFRGIGPVLDPLEWDVKAYLAPGGAVRDAAVTTWGIKGCRDSVRPISAIRGMADRGQASSPALPNYDPAGIPLIPWEN